MDYENATLTGASQADADKSVSVSLNQALSSTALDIFVVVPAGTYSSGFTVTVQDAKGHTMEKNLSSTTTLEAGKLYNLPEFAFVPTGEATGIEIWNAQDLIDFATAYNNREYDALGASLLATVMDDIVFDENTSAAFNATGGIGCKDTQGDNYFEGLFNGNSKTISGLKGTVPLFAYTVSNGTISDFTIDNTCSFTFTHTNAAELDAGTIVSYHRGTLKNVTVNADVSLAPVTNDITKVTALGGLVGRVVVGQVKDCNYSGNIVVPDTYSVDSQMTYIGGLVGQISNADGSIVDSDFEGTIDFAGTVASTDKAKPSLFIGGIIGSNIGTVSACKAKATNSKAITMDNNKEYTATIQNHSRKAYHFAQGGIAGQNGKTVSNCTNEASIKNFVLTTGTQSGTANDDNSRYIDLGGIVGLNLADGSVTSCTNSGLIESRCSPRIQKMGGVVGLNQGTVSSCSNTSNGSIYLTTTNISPYSVRVGEIGGVIGKNESSTVIDIQNAGNISIDRTENNAGVELKFGGVIGLSSAAIDGGTSKSISNSGNILDSYNGVTVTTDGLRFGGVVGEATASVKNAINTGNVTFQLGSANAMSKLYMGGIIGRFVPTSDSEISGNENSGEIYFNMNSQNAAHTGDYIGGIVGYITGEETTATVSGCDNNGYVHVSCTSTTALTDIIAGGIIGKMGLSGVISDCNNIGGANNAGEVDMPFSNAAHTENYVGGVLGKNIGGDVTISRCSNSGYVHGGNPTKQNGKTFYVGGIVAYLDGASSIANCRNSGTLFNNQFNNTNTKVGSTFEGGIAGFVLGTAENRIPISDVTNDVDNGGTITGSRRGYSGGTVGYGEYVDITSATSANGYSGGSGYWLGGIAGWIVNSTISNSTYSGTSMESSQVQGAGGIVCVLDAGTTIDGCRSYLNSITHGANACVDGDIAGKSVAGSTIKNCHYTGTYGICSDSNFTDGGGNVADL